MNKTATQMILEKPLTHKDIQNFRLAIEPFVNQHIKIYSMFMPIIIITETDIITRFRDEDQKIIDDSNKALTEAKRCVFRHMFNRELPD